MKNSLEFALGVTLAGILAAVPAVGAESRIEKSLRLEPGGSFSLQTDLGWVKVRGTDRAGARIVVTSKNDDLNDLLHFRFEEGPGSITVVARKRHPISSFFEVRGHNVGFEIEVPSQTRVTVDTSGGSISLISLASEAKLETSGGAIDVRDHTADVDAHTSGGSIVLSRVRGKCRVDTSGGGITADAIEGSLDGESSGGSIELTGVRGDIRAHTSGGGIQIRDAGGRVDAETSGGSVQAAFAKGNARGGTIESSGGGVSVAVDPAVGLAIDASGNSVQADVPVTIRGEVSRHHLQGTLGAGGETLRLRTSGGSIRIRSL
jgi:DUF4097 and DUF4098 domain-containing protein YvlB